MTNNIKNAILHFLIGVGFGGIVYSLILILKDADSQRPEQIGTVVLVSGAMGLVSMIFELEKPAFSLRLIFHFLAIYSLFLFLNWQSGNDENLFSLSILFQFILVYLLVWVVVIYITRQKVAKINEKLRERKESLSIENENVPQN